MPGMNDNTDQPAPAPHRRRARYRGTHPRAFHEKYKEHAPEQYPEMVEHVREQGRTPAGQHVPIMVDEVLDALQPAPGQRGVDATLGYGGHAAALLARIAPGGELLGLDIDPLELPRTAARLASPALHTRQTNFGGLLAALHAQGFSDGVDFIFADLGVSSMQLDDPARGFSIKQDGPLDMRMNPSRGIPASEWLARATPTKLAAALRDHADEPRADELAAALLDAAATGELQTTHQLARAVRDAIRHADDEAAQLAVRRVFQAVRIAVNDEFSALDSLLRQLPDCLRPGGRVAILSFHSGEDRRVKHAFRDGLRAGVFDAVATEVVRASGAERHANPRASSALLRWARRSRPDRRPTG
ncbi:MAG: 16S rRNA (cytosine(1402)-N(4))-methyltransferase RsmH [Planctomycetota bacterium]